MVLMPRAMASLRSGRMLALCVLIVPKADVIAKVHTSHTEICVKTPAIDPQSSKPYSPAELIT